MAHNDEENPAFKDPSTPNPDCPEQSLTPTPWAVLCNHQDTLPEPVLVFMTHDFYVRQLSNPDRPWHCPVCRDSAPWSDDNYEQQTEALVGRGNLTAAEFLEERKASGASSAGPSGDTVDTGGLEDSDSSEDA